MANLTNHPAPHTAKCLHCEKEFRAKISHIAKGAAKFCSRECVSAFHFNERKNQFWALVKKTDSCWLWQGDTVRDRSGYGRFHIAGKSWRAHRYAWTVTNGEIPDGLIVCHKCDTPKCVNPSHLFLGTDADNMNDRDSKFRMMHGVQTNTAKLTDNQVIEIRSRYDASNKKYGLKSSLGREYGVSDAMIGLIVRRKNWRHLL